MTIDELLAAFDIRRPAWFAAALCVEHPNLEFVPATTRTEANARHQLQVCGRCPVRADCLAYAVADPSLIGIWGGSNTAARRAMRLNRRTEAPGDAAATATRTERTPTP